jgi:protein-S-isoprenylcysteine O-methyltransferase Ste14
VNLITALRNAPLWSQSPFAIVVNLVVAVAVVLIAAAIVVDFKNYYRQSRKVALRDRSLVETGTMTAFFLVYYLVVRFQISAVALGFPGGIIVVLVGLLLVVAGAAFNIYGRVALKSGWANQIVIYEDHSLITTGPYAVVRHPLYASLIWMFCGGALIYTNPLSLALTLGVFVPMMYVRAKREDSLLSKNFQSEYEGYRRRTGMFLPKVGGRS